MKEYLLFALLGLGAGALYAALAQGIVLAQRGAGVINLANGAIAMYVAYTYAGLRQGRLMVPPLPNPFALVEGVADWFGGDVKLPRWPTFYALSGPVSAAPAMAISAGVSVLLGLLIHLLVYKPLRYASPLAKTVASVGILLTLQAIVVLRFGTDNVAVGNSLPSNSVSVFGVQVPLDRLILAAIGVLASCALAVVFRYTRVGLATRAAAENEKGAVLLGLSPNRLAGFNWMLASLISGMVGILFAPITGLNPTDYVLFVIPALGAALLARLDSFVVAAVAGLLIGCVQSITVLLQSKYAWFPSTGAATGVPFLVIIVAMVLRGKGLPERGALARIALPISPEPRHVRATMAILSVGTVAGLIFLPFDLRGALDNSLIGAIVALSFVVIVGLAGQISLYQLSLAGVAAILMTRFAGDMSIPFPLSGVLAAAVAMLVGVVAGLPALRVRGAQFAVLTLAGAYVFENMVLDSTTLLRSSDANASVPAPEIFGWHFGVNGSFAFGSAGSPNASFGFFLLVVTLLCFGLVAFLRRSDLGRQFLAVRSNERAAAGLGISITRVKLIAFAVAALLAGVAGVLYAYEFQSVTAVPYLAIASVSALAFAYLGGISTLSGAVVGGILVNGGVASRILERVGHLGQYESLIAGLGLILTAVLNPAGISGAVRDTRKGIARRLAARRGKAVTSSTPDAKAATSTEMSRPVLDLHS